MKRFSILLVLLLSGIAAGFGQQPSGIETLSNGHKAVAGEVLVQYKADCEVAALRQHKHSQDVDTEHGWQTLAGFHHLHSRSKTTQQMIDDLSKEPCVESVVANGTEVRLPGNVPNDPWFAIDGLNQWGLKNTGANLLTYGLGNYQLLAGIDIDAEAAWNYTTGSSSVLVGIVDTGLMCTHSDLSGNCFKAPSSFTLTCRGTSLTCPAGTHGVNAATTPCSCLTDTTADTIGHGTEVAGVIGAVGNNNNGIAGVNWNVSLVPFQWYGTSGNEASLVSALDAAVQFKNLGFNMPVVNNSWDDSTALAAYDTELTAAQAAGILMVFASGNDACNLDTTGGTANCLEWPQLHVSEHPNQINVAGVTWDGTLACCYGVSGYVSPSPPPIQNPTSSSVYAATGEAYRYIYTNSDYGPNTVAIAAPSDDTYTTEISGGYGWAGGTSFAAPHVAGVAALVMAACPTLTTGQLKNAILGTARYDQYLQGLVATNGIVDAGAAVASCMPIHVSTSGTAKQGFTMQGVSFQ